MCWVCRDTPGGPRLGVPVRASITIAVTGGRRLRGLLRDAWEPTVGAEPARQVLDIPGGESRTLPVTFVPRRRGERRTAFVAVRSLGPLGLAGRQAVIPAAGALRILPPFHARRPLPARLAPLREFPGNHNVHARGPGNRF